MYLSRLILNAREPATLRLLGNPYAMHQFLWHAFPDGEKPNQSGERNILWRIEPERDGPPVVLVQSDIAPDWCRPDSTPFLARPETKSWEPRFSAGQRLRFRLRANPTKSIPANKPVVNGKHVRGQRVGLMKEVEQIAWLIARGEKHGFRVSERMLLPGDDAYDPSQNFFRIEREATWYAVRSPEPRRTMTWLAVDFEGELEVTDLALFTEAVCKGLGTGKAFGFGLLSLARPR